MFVMYQIFRFTPPELSQSEKIRLGKEILKVGPDVFAKAFKKRLATLRERGKKEKPLTWNDVFYAVFWDIKNPPKPPTELQKGTAAALCAAAGAACVAFAPAVAAVAVPLAGAAAITGGSYWWMSHKVDLWIRDLIAVAATAQLETQKVA